MIAPLFKKSVYNQRRSALSETLEPHRDLLIFFTSPPKHRNHDATYKFRADSSFLYLTGLAEEGAAFLLWKEGTKKASRIRFELFVLPKDLDREQWNGYRWGPKQASREFGADQAFAIAELRNRILNWLHTTPLAGQSPRILSNAKSYSEHKLWLDNLLDSYAPPHRSKILPIESVVDARPLVERLRLIKSPDEIKIMKEASKINVKAHLEVMKQIKAGLYEYELQAICEYEFQRAGCEAPAYPSICAGGSDSTILHYLLNNKKLADGDLFLIDAGCEYKFYASDITRTIPVSKKFSKEQKAIMDIVAEAHQEVIRIAKPGLPFYKLHLTAENVLIEGLKSLKILKGSTKQIHEKLTHKKYYPHGTSHWLGMDVHDACPYLDESGNSIKLEPGMVFTVEPGLYFLKNDKSVSEKWRGIGVRIEDDILITKNANEVLTADLPRYAAEIEKYMGT